MRNTQVPLALVIKLFVLGATLAAVLPVAVILFLDRQQTDGRLRENAALVRTLNNERIARQRAINQFIFEQCVDAEVRDTVNVKTNLAIIRLLRMAPRPSPAIRNLIRSLEDSVLALEPPGEKDCKPPAAASP